MLINDPLNTAYT